jgi:hypothetical protein
MSRLRANQITNENANGAPNFPHGLTVTGIVTASSLNSTATQIVAGAGVTANSGGVDTVGVVTATSFKNKAGGTFAPNPTTTRGDIIVRGASANERLAIGSAGQVLKVNSSANGLEYGGGGILERVYSWIDNTQVCPSDVTSSGTGSNVFSYTIVAKTANPYYEINWNFFWGLASNSGDGNEIMAIAGIFNSSNQCVYGFGYKKQGSSSPNAGGSSTYRANSSFRGQTQDYILLDNDAGMYSGDNNWTGVPISISSFGNRGESDNGAPGRCGDGGTTGGVSAGDTLTLKGWVGAGNLGCYNRTQNQNTKMDYAIINLKEYSSLGQ